MTVPSLTRFKRCSKCYCTKPIATTFFGKKKSSSDGLSYWCKVCKSACDRERYQRNRAQIAESGRVYRENNLEARATYIRRYQEENREAIAERRRQYYEENRASILARQHLQRDAESAEKRAARVEYQRKYRAANKESLAEWQRQYRVDNLEMVRQRDRDERKRNRKSKRVAARKEYAVRRGAEREPYTDADLNAIWHEQGGCCAYCSTPLFDVYHRDHVVALSRGGTDKLANIVLACPTCNVRKGAKPVDEFLSLLKKEEPI